MENKKISQLDPYSGSPDSFDIPGVADGQTLRANLGAAIQQKITSQRLLSPSDLKTVNGVPLTGQGDIALELTHPFKGWYDSLEGLQTAVGSPAVGDYAYIKGATASDPAAIYECVTAGTWSDSGRTVDVSNVQTFETGQSVNGTGIKDLDGNNDPNAAGVLSAEAGKELNERLYGSHDNSTSEEITLSSPTVGLFLNPSVESGIAYASSGNGRKGMIPPEVFASIKSYKFLRVTQGENYGEVTFVKKGAPTGSMTYQQLIEGGYLSEVHDNYNNVVIDLPANTTTDVEIPEDAYTAYFLYRRAADGSGVAGTYRKPTMVVGYGLKTEGELEEIWDKIREIEEGGDGGSEEPIDGADILDGTVGGEKLIHATEEFMPFSLIDYDSLVGGTLINSIGDVGTVVGQNYRATNFISLMGKRYSGTAWVVMVLQQLMGELCMTRTRMCFGFSDLVIPTILTQTTRKTQTMSRVRLI